MLEWVSQKPLQLLKGIISEAISPSDLANSFSAPSTLASSCSAQLCQPPLASHSKSGHNKTISTQEAGLEGGQHAEWLLREWCVFLQKCLLPLLKYHCITLSTLERLFSKNVHSWSFPAQPYCNDAISSPFLLHQHNSGAYIQPVIQSLYDIQQIFMGCPIGPWEIQYGCGRLNKRVPRDVQMLVLEPVTL